MPILYTNWLLFFPIACALGLALLMSGEQTERQSQSLIRTATAIAVRMFFLMAFLGLATRGTAFQIVWGLIAIGVLISYWLWELELARRSLLLIFVANVRSERRLAALVNYLQSHTRGLWRRRGVLMADLFANTRDWMLTAEHSGLASSARTELALRLLRYQGTSVLLEEELSRGESERIERSRLLGRLLSSATSMLLVVIFGFFGAFIIPTLLMMSQEFGFNSGTYVGILQAMQSSTLSIATLSLVILLMYSVIVVLYWFPILLRYQPFELLFHRYYRAISLLGLAETVTRQPNLAEACRGAGVATPIPVWSRRLADAAHRLDSGFEPARAFQVSRLLSRREAATLDSAIVTGSLPTVIRELADDAVERTFNRYALWVQILVVGIVLMGGALVLLLAYSMIGLLSAMVEGLAQW